MTLVAPVPAWMFEHWNVVGGKYALPSSQRSRREFGEHGRDEMDRIARELRIRDVALDPLDDQRPGQRAAAPVLDHVAELVDRGRLADDAIIDAARRRARASRRLFTVPSIDGPSSSDVISSAMEPGAGPCATNASIATTNAASETFHVGRAAAVEVTVAHAWARRVRCPCVERTGRHDVGVAGEADERGRVAQPRPQVGDAVGSAASRSGSRAAQGARRAASWQPASSGVSERRAISSRASASVGRRRRYPCRHGSKRRQRPDRVAGTVRDRATLGCAGRRTRPRRAQLRAVEQSAVDRHVAEIGGRPHAAPPCDRRLRVDARRRRVLVDEPGEVRRRIGRDHRFVVA